MAKRNKHVLINLTTDQYEALIFISDNLNRKTSDAAYLLLIEIMNKKLIDLCDIKSTEYKKLKYKNDD